jgi:hypothetical protein
MRFRYGECILGPGKQIPAVLTLAAPSLRWTMPRDEVPANNANPAETLRARALRVHRSGKFPNAASVGHRSLLARPETMRAYVVATGIALGLLAVWAALVPFVA